MVEISCKYCSYCLGCYDSGIPDDVEICDSHPCVYRRPLDYKGYVVLEN